MNVSEDSHFNVILSSFILGRILLSSSAILKINIRHYKGNDFVPDCLSATPLKSQMAKDGIYLFLHFIPKSKANQMSRKVHMGQAPAETS